MYVVIVPTLNRPTLAGMRMHDGMVMANKGFQDKLFKLYTGQSLKGVSSALQTKMQSRKITAANAVFHIPKLPARFVAFIAVKTAVNGVVLIRKKIGRPLCR